MMLDCALEISFLGVLGGIVVSGMGSSGFVRFMFRGMRIHFSQDHMCRVLQNFRKCRICSVSEGLRNNLSTKKCEVSRVRVCEVSATCLASPDVKASLVCGSFKRLKW